MVMFGLGTCGMWAVRILVKFMYDSTYSVLGSIPVFIYGVKDGGIALAKSIRNEHPSRYVVKGFITNDSDESNRFLLGCRVCSAASS